MTHEQPQTTETLLERLRRATIGRYDIYAELGSGGMASVFLALDLALNRKVAIKVLAPELARKPDSVTRFQREARVAAALDHPNIIGVLSVGEDPALAYFVMKYVEGSTLDAVIAEQGAQSVAFARSVLATAGRALQYAHQRGVVHRDVKPANLMLDLEGRLVVTDFGIAKQEDAQGLTITGSVIGTPFYMSPEQFNGLPVTGATDQYALGVVAYELLTGVQPYRGATVGEVMRGHLFDAIPSVRATRPDVPESLDAAISRMLAKDPSERFATMDDAVRAIEGETARDESAIRTQIIALAKSGAQRRPEMHVPLSPVPAGRGNAAAQVTLPMSSTAAGGGRRIAMMVAAAIVVGAIGATAALRPDLLGVGSSAVPPADSALAGSSGSAATNDSVVKDAPGIPVTLISPDTAPVVRRSDRRAVTQPLAGAQVPAASPAAPTVTPNIPPREERSQPTAPTPVAMGYVTIGGRPLRSAMLSTDGRSRGRISRLETLMLPVGRRRIVVTADGCVPFDSEVDVVVNDTIRLGYRPRDCRQ